MSLMKEFNYPDIVQRRFLYVNIFFTFFLIGFLSIDAGLTLKTYYFYLPVVTILGTAGAAGLLLGNFMGKYLFGRFSAFRLMYILADTLFAILVIAYIARGYLSPEGKDPLMFPWTYTAMGMPVFVGSILFLTGVKLNYFLKVSCGDFIDEKQGLFPSIIIAALGLLLGMGMTFAREYVMVPSYIAIPCVVLLLPTLFLIKLPYSPSTLYAREYEKDQSVQSTGSDRIHLFYTYLNIAYVVIFSYLGYQALIKFYSDLVVSASVFIAVAFLSFLVGIPIGRFVARPSVQIYGEALLPAVFLPYLFALYAFHDRLTVYAAAALFIPVSLVFGVLLQKTISGIMTGYTHARRYTIIEFAVFVLPVPLVFALSLLSFTNLLYLLFTYILCLACLLVPVVHVLNRAAEKGWMKLAYLGYLLAMLPLVIIVNLQLQIPYNDELFASRTRNFEALRNINFNAPAIKARAMVRMNDRRVFIVSDSIVRNFKRALVPLALYVKDPAHQRVLFIDGNQKFFRNPVIAYYPGSTCLDVIPDSLVDYNILAISGKQRYVPEKEDLLTFLGATRQKYFSIVDIPNLLDQGYNRFRFDAEYYGYIGSRLAPGGIFVQLFSVPGCDPVFLETALRNLRSSFGHNIAFLFSNVLVVLSSASPEALRIDEGSVQLLKTFFDGNPELREIFLDEYHLLSHVLATDLEDLARTLPEAPANAFSLFRKPVAGTLPKQLVDSYLTAHAAALPLAGPANGTGFFRQNLQNALFYGAATLTLLKKVEYAESTDRYLEEPAFLFELQKASEYQPELRKYILNILSYKENYYYESAIQLEKEKRWQEARELYSAILVINKNNFEANYRLGLLCLTLQDIENAFKYLQFAMNLQKDHPKVLYQMGVLLFSTGKFQEAIDYFNRALEKNEKSASLYQYLGQCYENLNNMPQAELFYAKALIEDPNDVNIKSRIATINKKKEDEINKWKQPEPDVKNDLDEEKGEEMPLPINKSAYDYRINDDKSNPNENETSQ